MVSDMLFDVFLENTIELELLMYFCLLKMSWGILRCVDGSGRTKASSRAE